MNILNQSLETKPALYREIMKVTCVALILSLLLAACTFEEGSTTNVNSGNQYVSMVKCPVSVGTISSTFRVSGTIKASDDAIMYYKIDGIEDPAPFYELIGQTVKCNDNLYNDVIFDTDGVIVDVSFDNQKINVTLLDISKLYISALIDYDQYTKLSYSTPVVVTFHGYETHANIQSLGFCFENNMTELRVVCENDQFRPGLPVELCFTTDIRENSLYIPYDAVSFSGDQALVKIIETGEIKTISVVCGEIFESEMDGVTWKYVEIAAGLQEGDTVVFDVLDGSLGSHIYEEFIK